MKKNKSKLLLFLMICGLMSSISFAETEGIFQTDDVGNDVILESSKLSLNPVDSAPLIEAYILKINPKRDKKYPNDLTTEELSRRIAGVSYCFGIDPFVFTGLIHQESISFNQHAKSPTGAVGLTQFTTIAMREVNDQLGIRGNRYAQTSAINYFNGLVTGSCLEQFGDFKSFGANYVPLWEESLMSLLIKGSRAQAAAMVKLLATNPEYALVYGAILMKLNYSLVESGYKTGCYEYTTKNPVSMHDKIREVMMMYNGDGCDTQKVYQSHILDKFYPAITGVKAE